MPKNTPPIQVTGREGGPLLTIAYILTDTATGQWALVDPTYSALNLWRERFDQQPPQAILITHAHFDHVAGLAEIRKEFPDVPVWVHPDGQPLLADASLNGAEWSALNYEPSTATHTYTGGDEVMIGQTAIKVLDSPGHCVGSVMLLGPGFLVAGDVIFRGSVGRWDLPGGSFETLAKTISTHVLTLPIDTVIYPGHGPSTTADHERRKNPIVRQIMDGATNLA